MATTLPVSAAAAIADATPAQVLAQVPAHLLHIAAQFAYDDDTRGSLHCIHLVPHGDGSWLRIAATNGHIAFRCVILADSDQCRGAWVRVPELLLPAKVFKKRAPYAQSVLIRGDGEARFYGAKRGEALGLLEARPVGDVLPDLKTPFPPGFDQCWPEAFSNAPGAPVAFNASYMSTICAAAERYGANSVLKMQGNGATTPLLLTANTDNDELMQFLLMPVQLRN
jgi:hypothetical protein